MAIPMRFYLFCSAPGLLTVAEMSADLVLTFLPNAPVRDKLIAETKTNSPGPESKQRSEKMLEDSRMKARMEYYYKRTIPVPVTYKDAMSCKAMKPMFSRPVYADKKVRRFVPHRDPYSPYSRNPWRRAPHRPIYRSKLAFERAIFAPDRVEVPEAGEADCPKAKVEATPRRFARVWTALSARKIMRRMRAKAKSSWRPLLPALLEPYVLSALSKDKSHTVETASARHASDEVERCCPPKASSTCSYARVK